MTLQQRFEQYRDDFLNFELVHPKQSNRPDLHAFLLLDRLQPGDSDIVNSAEHDEIGLDIDHDDLNEVISDDQIQELVRCGVRFGEYGHLMMFV